jgi:two-component system chemotaxis response regulator CheB
LGHDGATAALAVHRFGGLVIASDERSSAFFAMPKAAIERDNAVDYVLPINEIAPALVGILKESYVGLSEPVDRGLSPLDADGAEVATG